jgi:hypothetical protein
MALLDEDTPISLKQLRMFCPELAQVYDRQLGTDYDTFIKVLYDDIDTAVRIIEANRDVRSDDSEDRTTEEITTFLKGKGYDAEANSMRSGHCDLLVKNRHQLEWLGEAKKHSSYDYLLGGFKQLTTRYSSASRKSNSGGMLIYIRTDKPAADVIAEWRSRIGAEGLPDYSDADCDRRNELAFYTTHKHETSGLPYKVRHMGVMMKFAPKDRKTPASKPATKKTRSPKKGKGAP